MIPSTAAGGSIEPDRRLLLSAEIDSPGSRMARIRSEGRRKRLPRYSSTIFNPVGLMGLAYLVISFIRYAARLCRNAPE